MQAPSTVDIRGEAPRICAILVIAHRGCKVALRVDHGDGGSRKNLEFRAVPKITVFESNSLFSHPS